MQLVKTRLQHCSPIYIIQQEIRSRRHLHQGCSAYMSRLDLRAKQKKTHFKNVSLCVLDHNVVTSKASRQDGAELEERVWYLKHLQNILAFLAMRIKQSFHLAQRTQRTQKST